MGLCVHAGFGNLHRLSTSQTIIFVRAGPTVLGHPTESFRAGSSEAPGVPIGRSIVRSYYVVAAIQARRAWRAMRAAAAPPAAC